MWGNSSHNVNRATDRAEMRQDFLLGIPSFPTVINNQAFLYAYMRRYIILATENFVQ
jgi:hypothetical protein